MSTVITVRLFCALVAVGALAACSSHSASSSSTTSGDSGAASDSSSQAGSGQGHVRFSGDYALDSDFEVDQCMISPPSEGLLGGYQMHAKDSKQFELLGVRISDFQKDATYSPVAKTMEGHLAETMSNGSSGPITLQLIPSGQQLPVQLIDMPKTKLDITISDNGMKGEARFTNLESPMDMKAMTAKMGQAMGAALKQSTGGPQGLPPLRREPQASRNLNSSQAPSPGRVPRWTASTRRRSIRCSITLCRPPRARKVREAG